MIPRMFTSAFVFLFFFPSNSFSQPDRLAITFSGGASYFVVGDTNRGIQGYFDYRKALPWMTITGDAEPIHLGLNFEGNLLINLTRKTWIEVGAGYLRTANTSEITANLGGFETNGLHRTRITAILLELGISYVFFESEAQKVYVRAGTSLYFADSKYDKRPVGVGEPTLHQTATAKGLGFQSGLGWELKLTWNIALVLDGQARYAKIGGFKGTKEEDFTFQPHVEKGTLYYWEETMYADHQPYFVGKYPQVYVEQDKPTGSSISNVREAKIDFSGFSLMGGIKFYF